MQPLEHFDYIFPDHRIMRSEGELRYYFLSQVLAEIYQRVATRIIIKKALPLTAEIETWQSSGVVREVVMVVRQVPEEHAVERMCADECQDGEELFGGWWSGKQQ